MMGQNSLLTGLGGRAARAHSLMQSRVVHGALCLLLGCVSVAAQSGLKAPTVGMLRNSSGDLRPLFGVRGNFLTGEVALDGVEAATFSGSGGLVSRNGELVVTDREAYLQASRSADTGGAVLGIDRAGSYAAAWLPKSGEVTLWTGEGWETTPFTPLGDVVGVAPGAEGAVRVAVDEGNGVRLVDVLLDQCTTIDREFLAGADGPVWLDPDGTIVFVRESRTLVIRSGLQSSAGDSVQQMTRGNASLQDWANPTPAGAEQEISLPMPIGTIESVGTGWLRLAPDGAVSGFLLDMNATPLRIYQLPAAAANRDGNARRASGGGAGGAR